MSLVRLYAISAAKTDVSWTLLQLTLRKSNGRSPLQRWCITERYVARTTLGC